MTGFASFAVSSSGVKRRPSGRLEPEKLEVIAGDDFAVVVFRLVVPGEADLRFVGCENSGEDLVLIAQVLVHGIGEVVEMTFAVTAEAAHGAIEGSVPLEANEFLRPLDGKHAQKDLIEEGEDGRVGADAERKRHAPP